MHVPDLNDILGNKTENKFKAPIRQLYKFLKEANSLKFRPIRNLNEHPKVIRLSDAPSHPSVIVDRPVANSDDFSDTLLTIKRPALTKCPPPPKEVASWIISDWNDPRLEIELLESQNNSVVNQAIQQETITEKFDDDEERVKIYQEWLETRNEWIPPELRSREAVSFFEKFYEIHSLLQKDRENLEFLIADGHLAWKTYSDAEEKEVSILHPIMFKKVDLVFDSKKPEFRVIETDSDVDLYESLFTDLKDANIKAIRERSKDVKDGAFHPFGWDDTDGFLNSLVNSISPVQGIYSKDAPDSAGVHPIVWRDTVLILRKKVIGVANCVDKILEDIDSKVYFSPALMQITGTIDSWNEENLGDSNSSNPDLASLALLGDLKRNEILLAKEANEEQIQIIRKLHQSGSVSVQGPPGTGKTHTIGNLIGHLLSEGKRILVTAHTAKALRVLRDKVPEMLQPLCVSVIGTDQNAKKELESAIGAIAERLTSSSADSLLEDSKKYKAQRDELISKIENLRHDLRGALENEYKEISILGKSYNPSEAARYVNKHRDTDNWVPTPIILNKELTLDEGQIKKIYAINSKVTFEEEVDSLKYLPNLEKLPDENNFERLVSDLNNILGKEINFEKEVWKDSASKSCSDDLAKLGDRIGLEFSNDLRTQSWRPYAIVAGMHGGNESLVWKTLIQKIETASEANAKHNLSLHLKAKLSNQLPLAKQLIVVNEIVKHLEQGGRLGFIKLTTHPEWKSFIKDVSTNGLNPSQIEHFLALRDLIQLEFGRSELEDLWNRLIGDKTNSSFKSFGDSPELSCRSLIPEINKCLGWSEQIWKPFVDTLMHEGLDVALLLSSQPRQANQIFEYLLIENFCETLMKIIGSEVLRRRFSEIQASIDGLLNYLKNVDPKNSNTGCIAQLLQGVRGKNLQLYKAGLIYTQRLYQVRPLVEEKNKLLIELSYSAPGWSDAIRERVSPHNKETPPGEIYPAWIWAQLNEELKARDTLDALTIKEEIDKHHNITREITQHLIDASAWGSQLKRMDGNSSIRQALGGWLDTTKRLLSTRKADRRNQLLVESRNLMKTCAAAVPVWIMPIASVADSFDPRENTFDVVIIDEASQADLNALIPLYLGKKIIVVGDHEQVTPLGVGQDQGMLSNLRDTYLENIPNAVLFDNMTSIYDIARQSFKESVKLIEHFRCVPEIIAFSNALSYNGEIRPLRESSSTNLKPSCVPVKVNGVRVDQLNKIEAQKIVDYIKAIIQHPAYANKTIGVISMLADKQAFYIQTLIHTQISSFEIESRRILSGVSGEFQGDERDIIFLSLVDSKADEGTLRAMAEGAFDLNKKRYNVAVSRARDQLFVFHSFDPELHLTSRDLRHQLLGHVKDPQATMRLFDSSVAKTESPFEKEVLRRLTNVGYKVITQWEVGYFRIDMVVVDGEKRLAVECDGDRYHPLESLAADIERQTILERLGWTFVRIRGSAFFRDPEKAMKPVFEKIEELNISINRENTEPSKVDNSIINELERMVQSIENDRQMKTQSELEIENVAESNAGDFDMPTH